MTPAAAHFSLCLHGADPARILLRHDDRHNALYLELDENADFRFNLSAGPDQIRRDRDGLLALADAAAQAALELGQLLPPEVTP